MRPVFPASYIAYRQSVGPYASQSGSQRTMPPQHENDQLDWVGSTRGATSAEEALAAHGVPAFTGGVVVAKLRLAGLQSVRDVANATV